VTWPPEPGDLIPNACEAVGVHKKLRTYSLDRAHRDGSDKAKTFRSVLGVTQADVEYLARALIVGLATTPLRRVRENPPHGLLCDVWIEVQGLGDRAGRVAVVRTAWELPYEGDAPRLVTAYIRA
jgi:hypothetical protein